MNCITSKSRFFALILLAGAIACGTLGNEANFPTPIRTAGVGPFRILDSLETGVMARTEGVAMDSIDAVERAHATQDFLFFAAGERVDEPPDRDESLPDDAIDWNRFEPRNIRRVPQNEVFGYDRDMDEVILEASESWEGDAVFDPFVSSIGGVNRLYYAGSGGIGLASGDPLSGTLASASAPLIENARHPSVVEFAGEQWMFFDAGGEVGIARSSDGTSFTEVTRSMDLSHPPDVPERAPRDPALAPETGYRSPTALVAETPAGRTVLRVYFTVELEDGTTALSMAASEDGENFERFPGYFGLEENPDFASPRLTEDGYTLLTYNIPRANRARQVHVFTVGIDPAQERLVPLPEPETAEEEATEE